MRIWKWSLRFDDIQTIEIPHGAQLLSVQVQGDKPTLWALVDELAYKGRRQIAIYGTGNPMPDNPGKYIGTFQMHGGSLVYHAFDTTD